MCAYARCAAQYIGALISADLLMVDNSICAREIDLLCRLELTRIDGTPLRTLLEVAPPIDDGSQSSLSWPAIARLRSIHGTRRGQGLGQFGPGTLEGATARIMARRMRYYRTLRDWLAMLEGLARHRARGELQTLLGYICAWWHFTLPKHAIACHNWYCVLV